MEAWTTAPGPEVTAVSEITHQTSVSNPATVTKAPEPAANALPPVKDSCPSQPKEPPEWKRSNSRAARFGLAATVRSFAMFQEHVQRRNKIAKLQYVY